MQPPATIQNYPQPLLTIQNHQQPPSTTGNHKNNHAQPPKTIHNDPKVTQRSQNFSPIVMLLDFRY